jgi:hypothetical protein
MAGLRANGIPKGGKTSRQSNVLTPEGKKILELIRNQLKELYREVIIEVEENLI